MAMTMDATAKAALIMSTQLGSVIRISSLARKLNSTLAISFQVLTVILLMEYSILGAFVGAHIGKPCSFLRLCLPLSEHLYCDSNFTCRCRSDLPGKRCTPPSPAAHTRSILDDILTIYFSLLHPYFTLIL